MVEEKALAGIKFGNFSHVSITEVKVEYIEILLHSLYMDRFGDDDDTTLNQPP